MKVLDMERMNVSVFSEYRRKVRIVEELENILSKEERRQARNDFHAKRLPRPCGLTIHTGIGCDYACSYCYIPDMGFPFKAKPYPLTGKQLAYAVAINPSVAIGPYGTFLAFGSITEPFLKSTFKKTFQYLENVVKYLENPIQISTKSYISLNDAFKLRRVSNGKLSFLVTIITLKHHKLLEPKAPPPELRFETLYNLKKAGFRPVLFLRPIMPGINDGEIEDILAKAETYGVRRVLIGSFRVTNRILMKLSTLHLNTSKIVSRLRRKPKGNEQVPIVIADIKEKVVRIASKYDIKVYFQACQVCSEDCNVPCWLPCTIKYKCTHNIEIVFDVDEVREFLTTLGFKVRKVVVSPYTLVIYGNISKHIASFLRWVIKKKVIVKHF